VVRDPREMESVQVVIDLLSDQREKVVVALNASGQVREFQLRVRVRFKVRTLQGKELIAPTEILQQRDINYSETLALAKETEEALLYKSMQTTWCSSSCGAWRRCASSEDRPAYGEALPQLQTIWPRACARSTPCTATSPCCSRRRPTPSAPRRAPRATPSAAATPWRAPISTGARCWPPAAR
jgi:hypothetical protein